MLNLDVTILERLFDQVVKIAKEDNVISSDEQAILLKTKENIDNFKEIYLKAIEDNIIDENEFKSLEIAYKKIYSESEATALKDDILTKDEVKLISKIAHTLFTP